MKIIKNIINRLLTKKESEMLIDIKSNGEYIVKAFESLNLKLDFSLESLKFVDQFFDEQIEDGLPKERSVLTLGGSSFGPKVFAIGCYVGEVLVKNIPGAEWNLKGFTSPQTEVEAQVILLDTSVVWPIMKTIKRIQNGAEDSLYVYGQVLKSTNKKV